MVIKNNIVERLNEIKFIRDLVYCLVFNKVSR